VSHSWEVAFPILFCRCFERTTNEAIPFDETLKALSQFGIGTGIGSAAVGVGLSQLREVDRHLP